MTPIIEIKNISKSYKITHQRGRYVALRDIIGDTLRHPLVALKKRFLTQIGKEEKEIFWALKDINLTIEPGEAVGIIGANGAGKSTLLKILSQITPPTEGEIRLNGRVASLLEVGTGFHPELTGRENIFLNSAILGMSRKEVAQKFDSIVAFSGVEQFLDTPVKRYSSGMYVRLAFAIAAHIEPDILIVDEVLAVGDAEFQKKCLGKMEEVAKTAGRTVLFVSHNMAAVKRLCTRAIVLEHGKVIFNGNTQTAIETYLKNTYAADDSTAKKFPLRDENGLQLNSFAVRQNGISTDYIDNDLPFEVEIKFEALKKLTNFRTGIYVKGADGNTVTRSFTSDWNIANETVEKGAYSATLSFPERLLMPGNYYFEFHASSFGTKVYLGKEQIQRTLTVGKSMDFNANHPTESVGGVVLTKNPWTIKTI